MNGMAHRRQGVAQGDAGMGVAGRIDDDEAHALIARRLHAVDQLAFVIALEALQAHSRGLRPGCHGGVDAGQRGTAVNLGLAAAEQVQIGAVKYQNGSVAIVGGLGFGASLLRHGCKFAANTCSLSS
jgi:hypothetical protein